MFSRLVPELNLYAVPPSLLQVAQGPVSVRWSTSVVNRAVCALTSSHSLGTAWDPDMLIKPRKIDVIFKEVLLKDLLQIK